MQTKLFALLALVLPALAQTTVKDALVEALENVRRFHAGGGPRHAGR